MGILDCEAPMQEKDNMREHGRTQEREDETCEIELGERKRERERVTKEDVCETCARV